MKKFKEFWERTHYTMTKHTNPNLASQFWQEQGETTDSGYLMDMQPDQYKLNDGINPAEVNEL